MRLKAVLLGVQSFFHFQCIIASYDALPAILFQRFVGGKNTWYVVTYAVQGRSSEQRLFRAAWHDVFDFASLHSQSQCRWLTRGLYE